MSGRATDRDYARSMEAGFVSTIARQARRRLIGLSVFWAAWALALGIANGTGVIDSSVVVNFVR